MRRIAIRLSLFNMLRVIFGGRVLIQDDATDRVYSIKRGVTTYLTRE